MKNITLSAEEPLIEAARNRARAEQSTLNEQFRLWLTQYTPQAQRIDQFDETVAHLRGSLVLGRSFSRDEMNTR